MKETFREKKPSVIGNYLSSEAIKRQSLENSLAFRRPFFCEIEKQLLLEENTLLKPQGICPPLKSSVVFSVQNKNQRLPSADWAKKNLGNNV